MSVFLRLHQRRWLAGATLALGALIGIIACGERGAETAGEADTAAVTVAPAGSITVSGVGFQTPESVLHEPTADVYLVSNINGNPLDKDDNGFISRVSPDGSVLVLKWIDGAQANVELHAPKGTGVKGDTLFVADIDVVRLFHRETGAPLGSWPVPGAAFLNDVAVGPDGTVYVSDSGLRAGAAGFEPTGTDAVYRFDARGRPQALARGPDLGAPNGLAADSAGVVVVTFLSGQVYRLDSSGARTDLPAPPTGQLDGVIRFADGSLLVSSWAGSAVHHFMMMGPNIADAHYMTGIEGVEAPADIGYDATRGRVLIPLFNANSVEIRAAR